MTRTPLMQRIGAAVAAAAAVISASPADAAFPERPITMIVGFPAGGGTDLIVRGMQRAYERALGTQVVIKNVPGAGASIAAAEAADAPADGYTLLGISNSFIIQPHRIKVPYDPLKFEPVCLLADTPLVLVTTKGSPLKSAADLVAAAKAAPGKYPYGSPGPGSALHIGMAAFDYRLELKMKHIPFKGTSEIIQAMLAGTLNVTTGQPNSIDQYDLLPLAVLSEKRLPGFPDVPTAKEATGTDVVASIWTGIFAPPKTPQEIVDKLDLACKSALTDPETVSHFDKQKQPITYLGAKSYGAFVREDDERTNRVMEAAGLKVK